MSTQRYLFLIKSTLVLAQPLAGSTEQALACYERAAQQQAFADALSGSLPELAGVPV